LVIGHWSLVLGALNGRIRPKTALIKGQEIGKKSSVPRDQQPVQLMANPNNSSPFHRADLSPNRLFHALVLFILVCASSAQAANILWVSDSPPDLGFSGPLSGLTDQAIIAILQKAGHNVNRYDNPEVNTTLLTQGEIDAINTNDLVILGRAANSVQFQTGQGDQWNVNITKPLICMSPYYLRVTGGRLAWFTGDTVPDDVPSPVTAANTTEAAVDFLLAGVEMAGASTADNYDEMLDRNTSFISSPIESSGRILLSMTFPREDTGALTTAPVVADFQAGAAVRGGATILGGYRMWLAGTSRESATVPNAIPFTTGRETLTPTGEDIFLRAVELALNKGVPPSVNPAALPVITRDPLSLTVTEGATVSFSVATTGAAPRTVQWQRDSNDGAGFVNIAGASTPFLNSRLTLTNVATTDNNARFRAVASNANGTDTSEAATLTVNADTTPPTPLSVGSVDGLKILVCFDELLDKRTDENGGSANDEFNYSINGESPASAVLQADGKSVLLTVNAAVSGSFAVAISSVEDLKGNVMPAQIILNGSLLGLTSTAVGAVSPAGSVVACSSDVFQVIAGGLDFGINATTFTDVFQFAYKSVDGDFDAHVRVQSIVGLGRLESVSKAILTARNTTDPGSPAVNVFVTPQAPADDIIASSVRSATGVNTNSLGSFTPNGLPGNAWMRITRTGNNFTTYRSTDGATWNQLGTTTLALPSTLVVGAGAASHRNGFSIVATFSNFQLTKPITRPILLNPALNGTTFTASFASQAAVTYLIQYKNSLDAATWELLQTIPGDGTTKTITDSNATVPNRFYRITAQ
jgi:hypothetical protein